MLDSRRSQLIDEIAAMSGIGLRDRVLIGLKGNLDLAPLGKTFDGETIEKNGGTGTVFHSKKFTGCVNATLLRKRPLPSWPKHIIDNAISICAGPAAGLRISKEEGLRLRLLDSSQAIITSNG
ncbi:MAG: hypothetical protein WCC90_17980 [Methylocella sp.]